MKTPRATEADCQNVIVRVARAAGWRVHAERPAQRGSGKYSTAIQGDRGFPDLVLVRGPQLWFVELKRKPNRVEPDQGIWLAALRNAGAVARVVFVPEDLQSFLVELTTPAPNLHLVDL